MWVPEARTRCVENPIYQKFIKIKSLHALQQRGRRLRTLRARGPFDVPHERGREGAKRKGRKITCTDDIPGIRTGGEAKRRNRARAVKRFCQRTAKDNCKCSTHTHTHSTNHCAECAFSRGALPLAFPGTQATCGQSMDGFGSYR